MQQVLFHIPFVKDWFPPDGIPIHGYGAMLFLAFILVIVWGIARAKKIDMPSVRFQDFAFCVFISGLVGARILYMIQFSDQFPDHSLLGLIGSFVKIWEGGIIFYGSVIGGVVGYGLFYWFVMRRINVSGWKLADVVAPLLAMGLALGRFGCYLNGCCSGQVACEQCAPIPLGAAHFPMLTAPVRGTLVSEQYLQTSTGFAIRPRERASHHDDPRALVTVVETGSPADKAGLLPGDRIVKLNGKPNSILVDVVGSEEHIENALRELKAAGGRVRNSTSGRTRVEFDSLEAYYQGEEGAVLKSPGIELFPADSLEELTRPGERPRSNTSLTLAVDRQGKEVLLPSFTPVTIGLYPTQFYEIVSMVLVILLLLAYYPYRRHDGQLMVVLMICYSIHRFINESLRTEPTYSLGLTLSQWGSVLIFTAAVGMEAYLWCVMPSRWKGNAASATLAPPLSPTNKPSPTPA